VASAAPATRALHVEPARYDEDVRVLIEAVAAVDYVECSGQPELLAAIAAAPYDALFVRLGLAVDAAVLEAAPTLKWVVTPTTGLDHVDLGEAERRGVEVISLRGETAFLETISSTAEHTWALLLALCRRLPAAHGDVIHGHWRREPFLARELSGRTLGVVGCGRLGRMVAGFGLAFAMKVLVHDHNPENLARAPAGVEPVGLDQLLDTSDVVSLHLPLNESTRGFLSAERLARMRPGALLLNTARGELVDEAALLDALRSGRLAGAALDVLSGDSRWNGRVPDGHPLVAYARESAQYNLVLSPHVGGYGRTALSSTRRFVAQKFAAAVRAFPSGPVTAGRGEVG
jgi:D-3-phosphoglycerate dehydrogenase